VVIGVGRDLGLAFQIVDDILDATAESATLGKTAGKDAKAGKTTYVSAFGVDGARRRARAHADAARDALRSLPGDLAFLVALIEALTDRKK
jgi:geranylgeranyl diphosphate synthase type II